jgi:hypothetical protein
MMWHQQQQHIFLARSWGIPNNLQNQHIFLQHNPCMMGPLYQQICLPRTMCMMSHPRRKSFLLCMDCTPHDRPMLDNTLQNNTRMIHLFWCRFLRDRAHTHVKRYTKTE